MSGEITSYVPNSSISFLLVSKIHKVEVNYSVSGDNNGSTVTMESKITWRFPMNIIRLFIGNKIKDKIRNQTNVEFSELKNLCENG